jgi:tRNA uridine 5-carboxymethylaminomethyl modification enzyme
MVVGGGHAGIEASLAASRMGCLTVLVTMDRSAIGRMSCNPAIGGSAKGHLVREIDALGGEMGSLADATGIHFRMLNLSKGPAVWSPRCQNDREWYSREASQRVSGQPLLQVIEDSLEDVVIENGRIRGGVTHKGLFLSSQCVVLCNGTFLNAVMYTGESTLAGGRFGEPSSIGLGESLQKAGFTRGRLKTGTPPRLSRKSIDFSQTEEQPPDNDPRPFSYRTKKIENRQISMYLTYTNPKTHEALRTGFDRSPMFTGRIKGVGPRYCPSIEDKINRFADRERHQIFLEPEGYDSDVIYVNGFSTSLPAEVQRKAIATIPGLQRARMLRPGYAVEYDFFPPHQVKHTMETRLIEGLFFAGQINGTSGYEEAAGQGLVAGINAALKVTKSDPFLLERSEAYIGVMIDDLINKGTEEPYRIFTSRAEYRLLLRQDNADFRLMRQGHKLGLIPDHVFERFEQKKKRVDEGLSALKSVRVSPRGANGLLSRLGAEVLQDGQTLSQLLKRPEVNLLDILSLEAVSPIEALRVLAGDREAREHVEIEVKFEGYLRRQEEQVRLFEKNEGILIPDEFDYRNIKSLSTEGKEKLLKVRPGSVGQASRISGVTPADISILMISLLR